ncbi:MAG: SIP domain-containing protein [Actinomycetota bacterium]
MSVLTTVRQNTRKNHATVTTVVDVGDGLRRVRFSPRESRLSWAPGQAIATVVDPDGKTMKDRWRHYTIADQHDDGDLDLLLTLHGSAGPGRAWLDALEPGSTFTFMGPGGGPKLELGAGDYLLVGDRTSLASMTAMANGVGTGASVTAIVATPDPSSAVVPSEGITDMVWIEATSAESIQEGLVAAVRERGVPSGRAYVTGEMHAMRAVRKALGDMGLGRREIGVHAHWTPAKRGM